MYAMKEYQKDIYRDLLDETDWVGVEEVHPHGLERVRFYVLVALGTKLERRCGRDSKRFKCGCQ